MLRPLLPILLVLGWVLACTPETPATPDMARRAGLGFPSDPPLAVPLALMPAMPEDCGSSPELGAVRTRPGASTLAVATALERARHTTGHPSGAVGQWLDKEPTDSTLVKLRDGRTVWMLGFAEPPPFSAFGPWGAATWTAWIALLDARTGDYVVALSCGRVDE